MQVCLFCSGTLVFDTVVLKAVKAKKYEKYQQNYLGPYPSYFTCRFNDQTRTKRRVFLEEQKNCPSWEQSKDNLICTIDNGTKIDEEVAMVDWYSIDMGVYPGSKYKSHEYKVATS